MSTETSIDAEYARRVIDTLAGNYNDTLRSVNGEIVQKIDDPGTYHDAKFIIELPPGVNLSDSRALGQFGAEDGATFEIATPTDDAVKMNLTIDTDRGKLGITATLKPNNFTDAEGE